MKAIAVRPGTPNSVHLAELPKPSTSDIADGRGVLVRVLKVGVDATDREINDALYGKAPQGYDFLVIGHECFGVVEEIGPNVRRVKVGDYVTCTVRRPGSSIYDRIGRSDITSEEEYYERGINLRHGYLTEYFADDEEFIVRIPVGLRHLHVLAEPMSCAAKPVGSWSSITHRSPARKPDPTLSNRARARRWTWMGAQAKASSVLSTSRELRERLKTSSAGPWPASTS